MKQEQMLGKNRQGADRGREVRGGVTGLKGGAGSCQGLSSGLCSSWCTGEQGLWTPVHGLLWAASRSKVQLPKPFIDLGSHMG